MSDIEKNNPEEREPINFDDEKEPIESIEKTVEDLKRKIQELSDEEEKNEKSEDSSSTKDKISETIDTATKTITKGINDLKDKANDVANSEEMKKSIDYVKANAVKAMNVARDTLNQIKNDPNIQAAGSKATESIAKFADNAKNKGQDIYDHMDDKTKENLDHACQTVSSVVKDGVKAVDEFVNRPDVQQKIQEVKDTAVDLAHKGSDKINELIDNAKNGKQDK